MTASRSLAEDLDDLASRVNRNSLGRTRDHEVFLAEKDDIALTLRRLARQARGETRKAPTTVWRPGR